MADDRAPAPAPLDGLDARGRQSILDLARALARDAARADHQAAIAAETKPQAVTGKPRR